METFDTLTYTITLDSLEAELDGDPVGHLNIDAYRAWLVRES